MKLKDFIWILAYIVLAWVSVEVIFPWLIS